MTEETNNERMARLSEKMRTLEQSDVRMTEALKEQGMAIKEMHKIISVSNGTPSLVSQMHDIRRLVTDFISDYKAKEALQIENEKKWDGRTWSIIQSVVQWGIIAYLTYIFVSTP
jgi:hypothetical protein